jgi:alkylhydroperoxidase family enzyme
VIDIERVPLERMTSDLRFRLAPRVARLGYLSEFFQVAAHQPEALEAFVDFTEALKRSLPWRVVEIVALTVSAGSGNDYERVQHERLARTLGMSDDEIRAVEAGDGMDPPAFDEQDRLTHAIARDFVEASGRGAAPLVRRLAGIAGPQVAVGVVLTASRYLAHAAASNAWELLPPVPSPLHEESAHA